MAALNKANGRANVAIEIAKPKEEVIAPGTSVPAGFVAPPRTIADITAILDSEKPDPATLAKLQEDADDEPDAKISKADLAEFYYDRATARALLGRSKEAMADAEKALPIARSAADPMLFYRIRQFIGFQKQTQGDLKSALKIFQDISSETTNVPGLRGWAPTANRGTISIVLATGDIAQAEGYMRRTQAFITEARTSGHPKMRAAYQKRGRLWEADVEASRAVLFEARGQYREAEAAYQRAGDYKRASIPDLKHMEYPPPESQLRHGADFDALSVARMKAKQGRLAEAEVDARRVLLSRLKEQGKYQSADHQIRHRAGLDSGRAGPLCRCGKADSDRARNPAHGRHIADDTHFNAQIMSQLGAVLTFQRKPTGGRRGLCRSSTRRSQDGNRPAGRCSNSTARASMRCSPRARSRPGLAAAQELLKREIGRVGEKHFDTAAARGTAGGGLCARRARSRRGPRVQGRDSRLDGGVARERR